MCDYIELLDGTSLGCVDEIRAAGFVVEESDYTWEYEGETFVNPTDSCLCNVDIDTILARANVVYYADFDGGYLVGKTGSAYDDPS